MTYFHCKVYLNIRGPNFLLNKTGISPGLQKKKELNLICVNTFFILQTANQNDKATRCMVDTRVLSASAVTLHCSLIHVFKHTTVTKRQRCQSTTGFHSTHTLLELHHLLKQCFIMKESLDQTVEELQ